ncbi:MAG: DUF4266 domain-containing protein [Flavobacteriaceae bacterium]|nr:DUF4266 domain-containing protein [Flavobacteriaceae bacterium]
MKKGILALLAVVSFSSCVAVKEYEKININDPDMKLSDYSVDRFKNNALVYREASSGGSGGKTGGGCGCN